MTVKLKNEKHRQLLEKLESRVDLEFLAGVRRLHKNMWEGKSLTHLPCILGSFQPDDWPLYTFSECWDDIEKNVINSLGIVYGGTILQDDRLCQIRPEYGVVNIPELFGVKSKVMDTGNSMSEGLNDVDSLKRMLARGIPDFGSNPHTRKILDYYHFAQDLLSQYPKLSEAVHFTLPDTQGPFDLACLIWGSGILLGIYDEIDLVKQLLDLFTETFIEYNKYMKGIIGEPPDSAVHICGLPLLKGGVRICDDSATLVSAETYRELIVPRNEKAFAPFGGGWLHYCGNGNHVLPRILSTKGVHALHLGNPDMHDFRKLLKETGRKGIVLFWSGALEELSQATEESVNPRLLVLVENRYEAKSLDDAKRRLDTVRQGKPISKTKW